LKLIEGKTMTLDPQSKYPMNRSYVLKLHRESRRLRDAMAGHLENMATGTHRAFSSGDQLLELLEEDLAASEAPPRNPK
jgi:hypothetical protein